MTTAFIPRPYPPPMLAGVPYEYVVDKLRDLAPSYWQDAQTSDCTLVIPTGSMSNLPSSSSGNTSRRATDSVLSSSFARSYYHTHVDYLSCQSTLLRGILSGASALNLISHLSTLGSSTSFSSIPYLLPSTPHHPVICLPVPDPSSFELLLHWMYFGDFTILTQALYHSAITWQGLVQNAIYLGLAPTLLEFLQDWVTHGDDSDDEAGLTDSYSSDTDDDDSWGQVDSDNDDDEKVEWRGRSRTQVILSASVKA